MANRTLTDTATIAWDEATAAQVKGNVVDDSITNAKLANMAQATIKGRASGAGTGDPTDLTAAQVGAILGFGVGSGYIDLTEIAEPASPAVNVARTFARDVSGRTEVAYKNSSGQVTDLLRGLVSPKDYGAVGDGTTDDTAAITAVDALVPAKYVPVGVYDVTLTVADLDGPYWGRGQIRDSVNNLRAPWYSAIKAAPSSFGNQDSVNTAYNGDLSKVQIAMEHRITGTTTLGQPASGYSFYPEAGAIFARMRNESGHNQSTGANDGRTMSQLMNLRADQFGQGDCSCIYAFGIVTTTKSGSTHFLANPAVSIVAAQVDSFVAGAYLNPYEVILNDNGFDSAGIGWVVNMNRTVATGAKTACWIGYRSQSVGSADVNSHFSAAGPCDVGLDFTAINTDASLAAVALLADDRIYGSASSSNGFYATSLGDDWIEFNSGLNAWSFVNGNTSRFQIASNQVVTTTLALFQSDVVVNHTAAAVLTPGITPRIQLHGTDGSTAAIGQARYSNGATGPALVLAKSRNASIGGQTVVQTSDTLGIIHFNGSDGTKFVNGCLIEARCSGTPGTDDMPTSLIISLSNDGSATPTERFVADHLGNVVIGPAAIATTATSGFLYIPSCPGVPTGVPLAYAGRAAMVYNSTANTLYVNDGGGWVLV